MSLNCGENYTAKFQGLSRLDKKKYFRKKMKNLFLNFSFIDNLSDLPFFCYYSKKIDPNTAATMISFPNTLSNKNCL